MTSNEYMQIEAMMHLETALGLLSELPAMYVPSAEGSLENDSYLAERRVRGEIDRRIWAALYLVQSLAGLKPENFAKVLEDARWYDARNETADVINDAKRG